MNEKVVLSLKGVTKKYPGVLALDNVSLDFYQGEIHALLGENGAGKSTLIKAIAGAIQIDGGKIHIGGQAYAQMTPHLSRSMGIEVIYQEFNLVPPLSVAENIFLGDRVNDKVLVDYRAMNNKAREIFKLFKIDIDPRGIVRDLSPAKQQIVEIAKAVSKNVKLLIMDEPSAPLSIADVDCMFDIIKHLKEKGVTVIYISHRLEEVFRISDRVTVMRDGRYVATRETKETSRKELIKLMVGRDLKEIFPSRSIIPSQTALEIKHLSGNGDTDISFSVKKGEILGLAGLVGSGRTELVMLLCGAVPAEKGEIWVNGKQVQIKSPVEAIKYKIGLLPEDRKAYGVFVEMGVKWNISFPVVKNISKNGLVDRKKETEIARKYCEQLNIKTPSLDQQIKNLSGGNQQKVVLAKSLATESNILIFDEPTRGIDVGAKQEIYQLMTALSNNGIPIIMVSSDMEELLGMSDRIVVLSEGKMAGEILRDQFSQDRILDLASGTR